MRFSKILSNGPKLSSKIGHLSGKELSVQGKPINAFMGIKVSGPIGSDDSYPIRKRS